MAKYTVLERDGKYYVATSTKKKYWPNTGTSVKAEAEAEAARRTALYHLEQAKKCFPKLDLHGVIEAGREALDLTDMTTDILEKIDPDHDKYDPGAWKC